MNRQKQQFRLPKQQEMNTIPTLLIAKMCILAIQIFFLQSETKNCLNWSVRDCHLPSVYPLVKSLS